MSKPAKTARQSTRKKSVKKSASALATCPVGGAGWCAYPFSVAQLQKRLKKAAEASETTGQLATSGRSSR